MTVFAVFSLWCGLVYLLIQRSQPLQPDKLEDDLGEDLDMAARAYRKLVAEAEWLAAPKINLKLSGKWVKR